MVKLGDMPKVRVRGRTEVSVTEGPETSLFEAELARYMGVKHAVATSSGTMALYGIFQTLMKGKRQSVLTSPLTFAATVNVPILLGYDVKFCDVDSETYSMDMELAVQQDYDILMPVHLLGYPVEVGSVKGVVVTDACEAVGSDLYGNLGLMSAVSFYPSHTIPAGEMGAVLTDDLTLASKIRLMKNNGRDPTARNAFEHRFLGLNYKSNDMVASIARSQLASARTSIIRRKEIALRYSEELKVVCGPFNKKCSYLGFPILCRSEARRDGLVSYLTESGVECRKMFPLMTEQPSLRGLWPDQHFPVAEEISRTGLYVPCHQRMTDEQVAFVIERVNKARGMV